MKLLFYSLLIIAIAFPAQAQTGVSDTESARANDAAHGGAGDANRRAAIATELLLIYVGNVDALLRDLADNMRSIAQQVEAGELTALQAQALKLETARSTLGRLETISAVYEAAIFYQDASADNQHLQGYAQPRNSPTILVPTSPTVSVKELAEQGK